MLTASITVRINRTAISHNPTELIIEVLTRPSGDVKTFVAYDRIAIQLVHFLDAGSMYVLEVDPHSSGIYDGEVVSARNRD
jgi:hypothetical protein